MLNFIHFTGFVSLYQIKLPNHRMSLVFFLKSGGWKSEIAVSVGLVSAEVPLLTGTATFSTWPHMASLVHEQKDI